jgi:hypothetical protein
MLLQAAEATTLFLRAAVSLREAHPLDRGIERANEDYRGGSLQGGSEFFTLIQRIFHARSTLSRVTPSVHADRGKPSDT